MLFDERLEGKAKAAHVHSWRKKIRSEAMSMHKICICYSMHAIFFKCQEQIPLSMLHLSFLLVTVSVDFSAGLGMVITTLGQSIHSDSHENSLLEEHGNYDTQESLQGPLQAPQ